MMDGPSEPYIEHHQRPINYTIKLSENQSSAHLKVKAHNATTDSVFFSDKEWKVHVIYICIYMCIYIVCIYRKMGCREMYKKINKITICLCIIHMYNIHIIWTFTKQWLPVARFYFHQIAHERKSVGCLTFCYSLNRTEKRERRNRVDRARVCSYAIGTTCKVVRVLGRMVACRRMAYYTIFV